MVPSNAVFRGNYIIDPDKERPERNTPILNSYRFSQPTLALAARNLPQWRYESSCLDFRICHRHADSCIFPLAILPPFILSFDFLSQIARNFMPFWLFSPSLILFVLFIFLPFSEFLFSFRFLLFVRSARSDSIALLLSVFLLRELLRTSGQSWKTTNFPPYSTLGCTKRRGESLEK